MPNPFGWPDWLYNLEIGFLPPQKNPIWVPTFAPQQFIQEPNNSGGTSEQPIAITQFPTIETAQTLQKKYDPNGTIITVPYPGVGGPDQGASPLPPSYALAWPNGVVIYCSTLAAIWYQNPNQPDAADNICQQLIAMRGAK